MSDIIFEHSSLGTTVTVYKNRLVVKLPGGFFGKTETILFRNIASIEKPPVLNAVDIKTNDGQSHRVALMPPSKTLELKKVLEENL